MSGKNFYKNKKSFEIDAIDIDKEPYGKKAHLNTLLDIMMMMSLKFYLYGFLKWLALIVIRQCLSRWRYVLVTSRMRPVWSNG